MIRPQTEYAANFRLPPVLLRGIAWRIVSGMVGHPCGILAAANDWG
jgi:hypothetical protein